VGGKYSDDWQKAHLINPRSLVPESIMPPYAFLAGRPLDLSTLQDDMRALKIEGVPYSDAMIARALDDAKAQAGEDYDVEALRGSYDAIAGRKGTVSVRDFDGERGDPSELDALIAYLQMLGTLVDFSTYQAADLPNQR
jgi:cytochrome c oxidase cbb3-type subunit 2